MDLCGAKLYQLRAHAVQSKYRLLPSLLTATALMPSPTLQLPVKIISSLLGTLMPSALADPLRFYPLNLPPYQGREASIPFPIDTGSLHRGRGDRRRRRAYLGSSAALLTGESNGICHRSLTSNGCKGQTSFADSLELQDRKAFSTQHALDLILIVEPINRGRKSRFARFNITHEA